MRTTLRRRALAPLAGLAVVGASVVHLAGQQRPTFVSGANLRTVDFHVIGANGLPITDLKPEEVSLRLDGKTRKVSNLKLVEIAAAATPAPAAASPETAASASVASPGSAPALPQPFYSNNSADSGRVVIVAIEDESFRVGRERPMRSAIVHFVDQLAARDLVGLVTMPHGGWKVHPTTDRERFKEALSHIIGHAPQSESGDEAACRTRTTLETLATMLHQLGSGGVPPTILFFSSKLSGPTGIRAIQSASGAAGVNAGAANIAGCELIPLTFSRVGYAAGEARAQFYIIQPDDEPLAPQSLEGIENLAGVTGATRLAIPANGDTTLNRVLRETTSYYLIGFEPEEVDNNGMSHSLDIRVSRPGAKVISRKEVMLPKTGFGAEIITRSAREMLKETRVFRDVGIRMLGYTARHDDNTLKVLAAVEPEDPSVKFQSIEAAIFDGQGKMLDVFVADAAGLTMSPALTAVRVPPGNYRLRVAATDASGRGGTVDQEITAELTAAGSMKLSSLVLGLSRGGNFLPRMQFSTEPVAVTFLEMYGGQEGQRVGAVLELAQTVDGPAFLQVPLVIEATSVPNQFKAMGAVPVGSLKPGDWIVRAVVQVEGMPPGQVVRTIRKIG